MAQLAVPSLATAAPYPPSVVTSTNLTLQHDDRPRRPVQHGVTQGFVRVRHAHGHRHLHGRRPPGDGHPRPDGTASWDLPTDLQPGATYNVTARYNGAGVYKPSSDTARVTVENKRGNGQVKGSEGSQGGNNGGAGGTGENGGGKGRTAPTTGGLVGEDTSGGLPGVGSDSGTMLYGLGGLVLLGAGGFALALNRRRSHA